MLPIVLSSQWDEDLARGIAFALGRIGCEVLENVNSDSTFSTLTKTEKSKEMGVFHMLANLHLSVERGKIVNGGSKSEKLAITVLQLTATLEQHARAMSAVRLVSSGNGNLGQVVVVEGQKQGTLITVLVDGKIVSSMDVAVTGEEEAVRNVLTKDTIGVIFLGDIVDEIEQCWPDAVTPNGKMLITVRADSLVHRKVNTETTRKGLFRKKVTTQTEQDTPFRLLVGAQPNLKVAAFRKIKTAMGRVRKPSLSHYFGVPFVFVGLCCVRVIDGHGGYFRFDFSAEKRTDWKDIAPKILLLAAGREV